MARLNEPVVAPDGMEILRRKFLRQNRDIARINSTQSLRIRSLENECARMLSENLELRGQILRLETEIQESRAQRTADHAMEIKEKMEAQLLEWGSMLASLGHEPIPKNRSPRASKKARRDPSLGLAGSGSPRFRRRNTLELEAAAMHEGRLAPLWENKPCPRETLNRDEILALCSEAEETDSPDLGPPPVSRFVDEEPVKIDLPTRTVMETPIAPNVEESISDPFPERSPKALSEIEQDNQSAPAKPENIMSKTLADPILELSPAKPQTSHTNLKRKVREDEEKENVPITKVGGDPIKGVKTYPEKLANRSANRPIKNLPLVKKDGLEKATTLNPPSTGRKPLGAKNANEAVLSPKKATKKPVMDEITKAKAEVKSHERGNEKAKPKGKEENLRPVVIPTPVSIPSLSPTHDIETETLSSELNLLAPSSPKQTTREDVLDTPPPADITSEGETSRGGRRARSNVSYAEPNLRDKMRRPSKQLFDAVAGEGKAMRRTSQSRPSEMSSINSAEKASGWKPLPTKDLDNSEKVDDATASPLVQKVSRNSPGHTIPISLASTYGTKTINKKLEGTAAKEADVSKIGEGADVYEFTSFSPSRKKTAASEEAGSDDGKKAGNSRNSKSRRLSSLLREDTGNSASETEAKGRGSRKRASMMVQKTTSGLDADTSASTDGDSSFNSNSSGDTDISTRGVSMRRRSMML